MEHNETQQSHAVERYLLNEMSEDERDGFEEHYFDCHLCAADVVEGERLMASGHAVASETPSVVPFPSRSWTAWIPAAAAAMLLLMNGLFLMPLRSGAVSEIVDLEEIPVGVNRSANAPPITLRAGVTNLVYLEVPPEAVYPRYEFRLRSAAGSVVAREPVSAKKAGEGVYWLLGSLPAGSYVLAIHGVREDGNLPVIATYEVRVR